MVILKLPEGKPDHAFEVHKNSMAVSKEGAPEHLGIGARVHRKLTEETAEVVGGVTAGSLVFITLFELEAISHEPSVWAVIAFTAFAGGAAEVGEAMASEIKQVIKEKRGK